MRTIFILFMVVSLVVSCKEEKKTETPIVSESKKISTTTTEQPLSTDTEQFLATSIAYFKNCKENAVNRNDCRNSITKMISEFYKIEDFKNDLGEYVIYDSIQPIVAQSIAWEKLGNASNQDVLAKAQNAANAGKATIAIDVSESYGQVAMILEGKLTQSNAWQREVPNAAVLVNYSADKSFMNKPLSYAFKSPQHIVLYTKK